MALGVVVLLDQAFQLDLGPVAWPVFVIVPGLALLGLGLAAVGRLGEVLATVGGVVTMAGLVLLVQNATDRFETWAYAWTREAPTDLEPLRFSSGPTSAAPVRRRPG